MLGGADNPNGELPSYITGANIVGPPTAMARFHWSVLPARPD